MVAISIFSLVIGMSMFSLRYAFGVFRHLDDPFAEQSQHIAHMRDCVASTFCYIGERGDMFLRNKEFYIHFYGEADRMTFVSTKPLAITGTALCRLYLHDGNVILEEAPLHDNDCNYLNPNFDVKRTVKTTLFTNVQGLSFKYFVKEKESNTIKEELPSLVKIQLVTDGDKREYFCGVKSDFSDKNKLIKAMHATF